jgi:uncharacterized protein (TIGR02145 family)
MNKILIAVCGMLVSVQLPAQTGGNLRDADGNAYPTVVIGTREWMAGNLRTTKLNDGTPIPLIKDGKQWSNASGPAYSWYNNDEPKYGNTYGALYNWYAVNTGKLCPSGWHVPTDAEWEVLTEHLGGKTVAGGKLKSTGADMVSEEISESELDKEKPNYVPGDEEETRKPEVETEIRSRWNSPNTGSTNETGFSAQPGGHRASGSSSTTEGYNYMGRYGFWWTSTESSPGIAWHRMLYYDHSHISRMTIGKNDGHSVRCVRDK